MRRLAALVVVPSAALGRRSMWNTQRSAQSCRQHPPTAIAWGFVIITALLFTACTTNDSSARASASPSLTTAPAPPAATWGSTTAFPVPTTIELAPTPGANATGTPIPPPSAPTPDASTKPDLEIDAHFAGANGFLSIDPRTNHVRTVWSGPDRMSDIDIYPSLAARGDGVWLSWDNGTIESVRYDLEGSEVDRVPGLWASESPNGQVVTYYTGYMSGQLQQYVARYAARTVDLGVGCCSAIRDDGRIAFLGPFENGVQSEFVYDPATDIKAQAFEGIVRPGKDGVIYPTWSPSGRFLSDFSIALGDPIKTEALLFDTETGQRRMSPDTWGSWIAGPNNADWLARIVNGDVVVTDAATQQQVLRLSAGGPAILNFHDIGGLIATEIDESNGGGMVVFDLTGREIARWDGIGWVAQVTTAGLVGRRLLGGSRCRGAQFADLARGSFTLDVRVLCYGGGLLSPDGQFLAVHEEGKPGGWVWIIEVDTGRTTRFDIGRNNFGLQWSGDGSRLSVRVGGGL